MRLSQEYGADVLLPVKFLGFNKEPTAALLTLVLSLSLPVKQAKSMTKTLISLGATCAQADLNGVTAFQRFVEANASAVLDTLWEVDRTGSLTALNHISFPEGYGASSPLLEAISNGNAKLVLQLLDAGAFQQIEFETWLKSAKNSIRSHRLSTFEHNMKNFKGTTPQPLISALQSSEPSIALELLHRGVEVNVMTTSSYGILERTYWRGYDQGETALDLVRKQLKDLRNYKEDQKPEPPASKLDSAAEFLRTLKPGTWQHWVVSRDIHSIRKAHTQAMKQHKTLMKKFSLKRGVEEKKAAIAEAIEILQKIEGILLEKGAKSFDDLHPDFKNKDSTSNSINNKPDYTRYSYSFSFNGVTDVTAARHDAYVKL
jgi:hypothetical protein